MRPLTSTPCPQPPRHWWGPWSCWTTWRRSTMTVTWRSWAPWWPSSHWTLSWPRWSSPAASSTAPTRSSPLLPCCQVMPSPGLTTTPPPAFTAVNDDGESFGVLHSGGFCCFVLLAGNQLFGLVLCRRGLIWRLLQLCLNLPFFLLKVWRI